MNFRDGCFNQKRLFRIVIAMSLIFDSLAMFMCMACAFGFGWVFFLHYLFKNYECHHRGAQVIFASVFSLSFSLLVLIIFEILDYII